MKEYAQMLEDIEHIETERDMYKKECEDLKEEIKHKNEKFSEWCEENRDLKKECENLKLELELQKKLYEDIRRDRDELYIVVLEKTKLCYEIFMKGGKWDLPWFLDTFGSKSDA